MMPLKRIFAEHRSSIIPLVAAIAVNVLVYALVVYPKGRQQAASADRAHEAVVSRQAAERELAAAHALIEGKSRATEELATFYDKVLPPDISSARRLTYSPYTSDRNQIRIVGVGGFDVFNQKNFVFSPPELYFEDDDGFPGTDALSYGQNINKNLNLNAIHVYTPAGGSFTATTSLGTQYETRDLDVSRTVSQNLLSGLPNLRDGTRRDLDEQAENVEDFGVFAQHEFLWKERLLLTGGIRADRSTNNGDTGQYFYYPKAAASYRFAKVMRGVDEVKARVAYGESGNQPTFGQKFTNLTAGSIGGIGGFTIGGTTGSKDMRPERQREFEAGLDLALFGNKATVELTGFERRISDLLPPPRTA